MVVRPNFPNPGQSPASYSLVYGYSTESAAFVLVGVDASGALKPPGITPVLANGLTTSVVTIAAAAAVLVSYYIYNPNAAVAYVQIFDVSGSVTLGVTVPKWSIGIPAGSAANLSGLNLSFANAIKVAATTTATGSSAPASNLDANFGYR